jgi:peptidoglycan/LPS O-acetylase OafA/YrhL
MSSNAGSSPSPHVSLPEAIPVTAVGSTNQSVGSYMASIKGFTTGFDYLRFGLSISVLVWHSYLTVHGVDAALSIASRWSGYVTYWILPMFFALSGFLIASSLERTTSLTKFLWLRFIRIYPALTVEVILSALILGVLATTLSLREYFTHPVFYDYLLNVLGWIHYELPGVFTNNPLPKIVNTSLWTVPYELECYIVLTIAALLWVRKKPGLFLTIFVLLCIARTISTFYFGYGEPISANIRGRHLVLFFFAAVLLNLNKKHIPFDGRLALLATVISALTLFNYRYIFLATLPVAYLTVWLGLQRPKKIKYVMDGDYSYGIYLYAAPIQQAVWHFTDIGKSYAGNVVVSLCVVSLFAVFSWHAIEKPMLRFKKLF